MIAPAEDTETFLLFCHCVPLHVKIWFVAGADIFTSVHADNVGDTHDAPVEDDAVNT